MEKEGAEIRYALHHQVGPVAHTGLVDVAEQVVGGVAGQHVSQARLDAHADHRQPPARRPSLGQGELLVPELHPRLAVRVAGMGLRQRHRHVHVMDPAGQGGAEDRHGEAGIGGTEYGVDAKLGKRSPNRRLIGGVEPD